jgi:RNA polymerase sigma factor (sigma-70 family)
MKSYNIQNYIRYKNDVAINIKRIEKKYKDKEIDWEDYTRKEIQILFLPLVENIARKFSTTQQASGIVNIMDMIQFGSIGLTQAVNKLDKERLSESKDKEKTLKSFLSKRIKGAIRRQIDINRGNMRIPEHKINEIRKNFGKDKKMVEMFFNSVFLSIDANPNNEDMVYQIPDESEPYNIDLLNLYLKSLCQSHLSNKEYQVLRLSYGLDCEKHSATEIANKLGIEGSSSYVRVSQLKKQAVDTLIENVDHSQVLDFL